MLVLGAYKGGMITKSELFFTVGLYTEFTYQTNYVGRVIIQNK